jgi:chorismate mutase
MKFGFDSADEDRNEGLSKSSAADVQAIVKVAHNELRRLLRERAEIMKRIGSIKKTITGLCNLFGDAELSDDLRQLVNGKARVRQPGITQACRMVLMDAGCPVTAREVCEQIQQRTMPGLPCSKNQVASVTTVLSRLVQYGEARTVLRDNHPRAWLWVLGAGDSGPLPGDSVEHFFSEH